MSNLRMGARIARQLQTAEHAVDHAMVAASALLQAMLEGRRDANLAAEVGHTQIVDVVGSLTHLSGARDLVVRSHTGLAEIAAEHDIGWRMEGPYEEKIKPTGLLPVAANG